MGLLGGISGHEGFFLTPELGDRALKGLCSGSQVGSSIGFTFCSRKACLRHISMSGRYAFSLYFLV